MFETLATAVCVVFVFGSYLFLLSIAESLTSKTLKS